MLPFNKKAFIEFIKLHSVVRHFDQPIILKSGQKSQTYINWRHITNDVYLCEQLAYFVTAAIHQYFPSTTCIYGVAEGATKLATLSQYLWAKQQAVFKKGSHSLAMGRAKPKLHGDPADKYYVGAPSGQVVVLEDVVTTGQSLLSALDALKQLDPKTIQVIGVLSLTDRSGDEDGLELLSKGAFSYKALSVLNDLM